MPVNGHDGEHKCIKHNQLSCLWGGTAALQPLQTQINNSHTWALSAWLIGLVTKRYTKPCRSRDTPATEKLVGPTLAGSMAAPVTSTGAELSPRSTRGVGVSATAAPSVEPSLLCVIRAAWNRQAFLGLLSLRHPDPSGGGCGLQKMTASRCSSFVVHQAMVIVDLPASAL